MKSTQKTVEGMLADMRHALNEKKFTLVNRDKNQITMARLGLLTKDVINEMMELTYKDYIKGPEVDEDFPNSDRLWFFKTEVFGHMIYIKFKIEYQKDGSIKCLSFHIDNM